MQCRKIIRAVSLVLIIAALSGLALLEYSPFESFFQTPPPQVIDPAQAYLFANGTLYLAVYNSGANAVSLTSVQVATAPFSPFSRPSSVMIYPNRYDSSQMFVEIYPTNNPYSTQSVITSTAWAGGGTIEPGSVALLKFDPPSHMTFAYGEKYYIAVGSEYFPSVNLEPFSSYTTAGAVLPSLIPVRAVVYPNESMSIAVINTTQVTISDRAVVSFTFFFNALPYANASYDVTPEENNWYELVGGQNLPSYMPLTSGFIDSIDNNKTCLTVYNFTAGLPLYFAQEMVTQITPIVSQGYSSSSGGISADQVQQSYSVTWQFSASGQKDWEFPLIIYSGNYTISSSLSNLTARIGELNVSIPSAFATPFYDGTLILIPGNLQGSSGMQAVTISFGSK